MTADHTAILYAALLSNGNLTLGKDLIDLLAVISDSLVQGLGALKLLKYMAHVNRHQSLSRTVLSVEQFIFILIGTCPRLNSN